VNSDGIISQLTSHVVDQIAAGEVIERPASVIKELLENAIDAGGRQLIVTLTKGGLERLSVEDNGTGMSPRDARLCIERHATSKLRTAEDLFQIRTLGFRGEALSSIAAVSHLTLTTRRAQDVAGTRLQIEAGKILEIGEIGCPVGTVIDVRDLFFNVPARRKFLRSPATEQAHILETAWRVILGAQCAGIVVQTPERRLLDVPEYLDFAQRVPVALASRLGRVTDFNSQVYSGVRVFGFIGETVFSHSDSKDLWFFVNGRFVRDRMLQRAVLKSVAAYALRNCPPMIVYLEVDPAGIDVNVHPQKSEVRFSEPGLMFKAVSEAISSALSQKQTPQEVRAFVLRTPTAETVSLTSSLRSAVTPVAEASPVKFECLAEVFDRFMLCRKSEEIFWLDAAALCAHWMYHALRAEFTQGGLAPQTLLFPVSVRLVAEQKQHISKAALFGFEIAATGPESFMLCSLPAGLQAYDIPALVADVLDALAAQADPDAILRLCAQHAVRSSTSDLLARLQGNDEEHQFLKRVSPKDLL
jgi:DNA mismatch repair protein MutL